MPVVASSTDFLDVARRSQQIDTERLDAFLSERQDTLPPDPRKLAVLLIREGLITTFQAEQFLLGKHKGFLLGSYRIIERLGTGGAGTVYLAEHTLMQRRVAIKVLPTPMADDPAMLERFRLEAHAAAILDHPNVVHVFDFRQDGKLNYIVMEYIDGPNLQQVLARKGALSVPLACEYARQAALGLHHAHRAGMVHRDVKPANLLVDSGGVVKVLDMGLARVERLDGESVTRKFNNHAVLGTADYLAPEQALNLHEVDPRADVYSLGATLYALLTGRPPFHDGSIGQKLMWHQTRDPEPVDKLRPAVPAELATLVARMLAKKAAARPASMEEVASALSAWAGQAPRPEGRPSPRSMADIRLVGPITAAMASSASTGKLLPNHPAPDTVVSAAHEDTRTLEHEEAPSPPERELPDLTLGHDSLSVKALLLGGLAGAVLMLVMGVMAFLLWGPRP
jgi:serine/threonine protein kinase